MEESPDIKEWDESSGEQGFGFFKIRLELVLVEQKNNKSRKILMGAVCKPPNSGGNVGMSTSKEIRVVCEKGNIITMGDFNLHTD